MEISERYDALPYPTKFFAQTNPGRMAALAALYDVEAVNPRHARILEFGCGDGSNLISHAFTLPDSDFVGIDVSAEHIKTAKAWAEEIGITNIEFQKCDVMEMDVSDFGEFDYLVAHGLISWIPEAVIEKVFELFGSMLAENGIGYVSYNTYPGAHMREMVREMMMFHTRGISDPVKKVESATSFLKLFAENAVGEPLYKQVLLGEHIRHSEHSPSDFYHDDLSDFYFPFRFSKVVGKLVENDLQYLCESEIHSMSQRTMSAEMKEFLKGFTDQVELEDYMDFGRGRQFRKTLFCRKDREIKRDIDPECLSLLALASTARPEKMEDVVTESKAVRFVSHLGAGIEIDHVLTKTVLTEFGKWDGAPVQFDSVLNSAKQKLDLPDWEKEVDICRRILLRIITDTPMIELYSHGESELGELPEKPKADRLAKWQLKVGASLTSSYGAVIGLNDSVAKRLVELADGTRNISEIEEGIREFVETEGIANEVRSDLGSWVKESLWGLLKTGIFETDDN